MSATNLGLTFLNAVASAFGVTISDTRFYTAAQVLSPSGKVAMYAGSSAPSGWLFCDGSAVSRATYASLFAAIGTSFGAGDGTTTFNLPNFQGIFPRGAGSQTLGGFNYGGTLGVAQQDQFQGHFHSMPQAWGFTAGGSNNQPTAGANASVVNTAGPISDGTNGTPRTGTETRPANLSINFIIAT